MKSSSSSLWVTAALIVVGLGTTALLGSKLMNRDELDVPLNPCGVNRSPYGEVIAMAMQGPINTYVFAGIHGLTPEELAAKRRELEKEDPDHPSLQAPDCLDGESCTGCSLSTCTKNTSPAKGPLARMERLIGDMRIGQIQRTNSLPANAALQLHLKHQAEDKLFMAYRLDPSHYANYASLHFFLIEGIGHRPELVSSAKDLAVETIDYCLSIDSDPRPALTAAAASTNILHLMFEAHNLDPNGRHYSPDDMMAEIARLDKCIAHYHEIAEKWDKTGNWELISPRRMQDCHNHFEFIMSVRAAALTTIERIRSTYAK